MPLPLVAKRAGFRPHILRFSKSLFPTVQGAVQSVPRAGIKWQLLEARTRFMGLTAAAPMGLLPSQGQLKPEGAQQAALLAAAAGTRVWHLRSGLKGTARGWTRVLGAASAVLIPVQSLEILRG